MRVIITGGAGLIGQALTKNLTSDGHEAIILSRAPAKVTGLPAGAQAVPWDGRTAAGWGQWVNNADAIVNLAGENISSWPWTAARKDRFRASRLDAGRAVVEAVTLAERKPRVVVQAAGVGYYGPHGDEILTEDDPPGRDFLARLGADWEDSTAPVEALGARRVVARLGVALSLQGGALPKMMLPFQFFVGGPLGHGRQWLSWIHLTDAAAGLRYLIENEAAAGPFNLTAPNPVTNAEFGRTLGRVLHRPAFMPAPAPALRLVLGEMSTVLLTGQRVTPQRLTQLGFTCRFAELEPALRNLMVRV